MRFVEPSPAPKPHPLQVQSTNLVLGMKKNPILRIKNHVLGIKKFFLRALKSQVLGKEKKRTYNIIPHASLMELSLG
jgi:hypothetical protein